jgi:hypothetical protein
MRRQICVVLAFVSFLLVSGPARAGDEFEDGFKDELGRVAAHEAVAVGRGLLARILLGAPAVYGPPEPAYGHAPPVYAQPVPVPVPVYVYPAPVYGYWGWGPRYGYHHHHHHHHGGHHDCD